MEGMQELFGIFVKNYNVLLDQIPIENRPDNTRFLKDEFSYFIHFCKYYVSGKNIFSISPDLVEKFYYSDIIGINVSDLKFPYKSNDKSVRYASKRNRKAPQSLWCLFLYSFAYRLEKGIILLEVYFLL